VKTLVIGLDGAVPDIVFGEERLTNLRYLMESGCYGRLESVIPPITVPAWMCMATSQDPGSLGVYGFRNRADHSYDNLSIVNSRSIQELALWDQVAREGGKSIILGVPPSYPPRKVNGVCIGCFLTPDTATDTYTHPAAMKDEIARVVGDYAVDVKGFRTDEKSWLKAQTYSMTAKRFQLIRHLMAEHEWDYFQFVEIGLDRMQHGFWKYHDPQHVLHEPGSEFENTLRDYYGYLDYELGRVLELLDDDTTVLVMSDHGGQKLDGGFCVNEWLVQHGLLVLNTHPERVTPFAKLDIDWDKTKVWSEGGYYARVFFNVRGREPRGIIDPCDYERFRDEIKAMFEATTDERGRTLGTRVYKPEEIYQAVNNVAPDLIVHFGNLSWRSIGGVGYGAVHVQENDTGPDDCNHGQFGSFILTSPKNPIRGGIEGAHLLNIAPTLLELGGFDVPASMQGCSMLGDMGPVCADSTGFQAGDEEIIRERLSGLGYIG
jgi:predicted AlkP superfamily phosphohydrolase/phosphomutase